MSIRIHVACGLALLSAATAASAQEAVLPLLTVEVRYTVDCGHRSLPSQRDVANWTGQSNFSQVYATRQRLMSEVGRACQQAGVDQVQLVQRPGARRDDTRFAVAALRR